jgi:ribosomal protein S20
MGASQSASISNWQQNQQNFKALSSALQSGDLAAAQKAFSSMSSSSSNSNSPLAQLGQALQNGDLKGAQTAMQAMQSRHHHHGGQSATPTASATPTSNSSTIGTVVNTTA